MKYMLCHQHMLNMNNRIINITFHWLHYHNIRLYIYNQYLIIIYGHLKNNSSIPQHHMLRNHMYMQHIQHLYYHHNKIIYNYMYEQQDHILCNWQKDMRYSYQQQLSMYHKYNRMLNKFLKKNPSMLYQHIHNNLLQH